MVADLGESATTEIPLKDKVVLRIDRHDEPERGCRLIEIALCNDRVAPRKIPVDAWLYQTKLTVTAEAEPAFLPVTDPLLDDRWEPDDELRRLKLQYRDRLEFAVGRTCSVDWNVAEGARRASKVWTTWLPVSETPQVAAEEVDALLDMRELAAASPDELRAGLSPIVEKYEAWLDGEEARASQLPGHLRDEGLDAVNEARKAHGQLAAGLEHVLSDADALRCFRFMNEVMADQRVQSQVARRRAQHPGESIDEARDAVFAATDKPHSWRTFQLAFILMQLPLLTDPAAEKRSGDLAKAQLLFFPTGGGKTEAYLGLAAYAFAIRRLQRELDTPDGKLDGGAGVTVLMRYTLRLLTAQQFQRATALVCAAEMARRRDRGDVGGRAVPDRAVGRHRRVAEAVRGGEGAAQAGREGGSERAADRAAVPALPLVRHPDRRGQRACRRRAPADLRVLRRRAWRLPVLPGRRDRRRAAGPHGGRGDLPAGARVRHRDRRQVRPAGAGGRGGVAVRLRVGEVRAARVRAPRLLRLQDPGGQQAPEDVVLPPPGRPAPAARPDHPGRAAPDHRRARHDGRAVRGRGRRAVLLARHRRRTRSGRWSSRPPPPRGTRPTRCARCTGGTRRSSRRRSSTWGRRSSPASSRSRGSIPGGGTSA